jgi:hypothetical protein
VPFVNSTCAATRRENQAQRAKKKDSVRVREEKAKIARMTERMVAQAVGRELGDKEEEQAKEEPEVEAEVEEEEVQEEEEESEGVSPTP